MSWEYPIPELNTSVFIIPKHYVKNREHRLIVLNETARAVVDRMRGIHDEFVFTYGRRLRVAGVDLEDRQDLLGHKSGRITTHYSAVEIRQLIEAANRVCERKASTPTLTLLKCQEKIPTISPPRNVGNLKLVK